MEILDLFLAEKLSFVLYVCCDTEKDDCKETIMFGLGIFQPLIILYSADLLDAIDLTSRWKVCFRQFFLNEARKVFYKLVSVTDPQDHSGMIYSPLNF